MNKLCPYHPPVNGALQNRREMSRVDKMDPCPICLDEEFEPVVLQCEHRVCSRGVIVMDIEL